MGIDDKTRIAYSWLLPTKGTCFQNDIRTLPVPGDAIYWTYSLYMTGNICFEPRKQDMSSQTKTEIILFFSFQIEFMEVNFSFHLFYITPEQGKS